MEKYQLLLRNEACTCVYDNIPAFSLPFPDVYRKDSAYKPINLEQKTNFW